MQLQIKVTATKLNSRIQKTGEDKGTKKFSVDIFGLSADGYPAQFSMHGLSGMEECQSIAAKYPNGTNLVANLAPREPFFVSDAELSVIGGEAKK